MSRADKGRLRAARGTPAGEGGISVIILSGAGAGELAASRLMDKTGRIKSAPGDAKISYGFIADAEGEAIDEVVVAFRDMELVEINCHGGIVPAERVLASLRESGVDISEDAACDAGGAIETEAFAALQDARTDLAARVFATQYGGMLSDRLGIVAEHLGEARDDEALGELDRLRESARIGLALAQPKTVAIAGPANAGKSTLVNALAGYERNIVTAIAGTTRDAVEVWSAFLGVPVKLVDTAGVIEGESDRDEEAARRARGAAERADATIVVIDASTPGSIGADVVKGRAVVAANKADLGICESTIESVSGWGVPVIAISALKGEGLDRLREEVLTLVGTGAPKHGVTAGAVVFTQRQLAHVDAAIKALGRGERKAALAAVEDCLTGA